MSTIEKLFVEIFRRKERIIDQFNHQVEQFDTHLAATLLLNGITPPPCLLHSNSSDPKEWKKEELISEVLLPHPQVLIPYASGQYFVRDGPAITGDKKFITELSRDDYQLREESAANDGQPVLSEVLRCDLTDVAELREETDANDGQPVLSDVLRCDLTDVAELNCPMKSPLHQMEGMISDPTHNLDLSLAKFQRSKIRQKALELRSSERACRTSPRDKFHADVAQTGSAGTGIVLSLSERINSVEKDQLNAGRLGFISCGIDGPPVSGPIISEVQPPPVDESMQLMSSSMENRDEIKFSKVGGISNGPDLVVGEIATNSPPCVAESSDNGPISGQFSSPFLEDLCPHHKDIGAESKLDEILPASQRLEVMPSDGALGNCQYTKPGIEVDQEDDQPDPEDKIRAPLCNGSALQCLDGSESCCNQIPEESAPSVQFSIPGLEDLGPQYELGSVKAMFIKSPSFLDFDNLQDGSPNRVEVDEKANSERVTQNDSGSSMQSLRMSPVTAQEVFQHEGSSGIEVDKEVHPKEVITAQKDNVTSLQDLDNPQSCEKQISEKSESSSKYSVPGLGDVHLQSGQSTESRVIEPSSPSQTLKFIPDTFHENLQHVVSTRVEIGQETERGEFITAQNGSEQDEHISRSCNLQLLQYSDSGSEDFCHRSKQRTAEGGGIKPPSGLEGGNLTSFHSTRRNFKDRNLSRVEAALVKPSLVAAQDGGDHQIQENSVMLGQHSSSCAENLCPQPKQRSVESVFRNPQSSTQSLMIIPLKSFHENAQDRCLDYIDVKVADPEETCKSKNDNAEHTNVSCDMNFEVLQNLEQCQIKSPCSQLQDDEKVEVDLQLKDRATEERGASLDRDAARQNLADPPGCSLEATEMAGPSDYVDPVEEDEFRWGEAEDYSKLGGGEQSAYSEEPLVCKNVPQLEESLLISANLIESQPFQSLEVHKADPSMPVLESFLIQKGDGNVSEDDCSFEKFNFEDPIVEHATATEDICKSVYMCTPSSNLLAVDELRIYQSVPAMRNNFFAEDVNCAFDGKSYSDSLPFPVARSSENKLCRSPPLKLTLWDRVNSHSGSSRAKVSLNPDLPCISEENEAEDEIQGIFSEIAENSGKGIPLDNIPEDLDCLPPVAEVENDALSGRCSLESTSSVFCSTRTRKRRPTEKPEANRMTKKRYTDKTKASTNTSRGISIANSSKKSLHHRFSKPKTSLRKDRSDIIAKESKRENIVCNVTSFLPLVQQKPAAGPLTGKRDVKVKALEAAEAAKRQAEKREMDRKLKKEAMKHERERMELENLKRLQQEKKQKEEERKKKEAEIAARKRLREKEEQNKENERKRKRVEEARKHQEKLCSKKEEKEAKLRAMHEKKNVALECIPKNKSTMNWSTSEAIESGSVIFETCATPQNCSTTTQLTSTLNQENFTRDGNQEPSYDISPYRCSDDEDEDDDERNDKFIPSWASKSRIALIVTSQQRWDPKAIFPPDSFCSISEVCLPRKYQLK